MEYLIYVGFNSRVVALHRDTGELIWQWKSEKGRGYATVMLDGDRLIVSVIGYTYCLDAATGRQLWFNALEGMGTGAATMASVRGTTLGVITQLAAEDAERASQSAAASATV